MAEGIKVVTAALDAGAPVESLYVADEGVQSPPVVSLVERALDAGCRVFDLAPGIMERVSDTVTPQAVCAVVRAIDVPLADLLASPAGDVGRLLLVAVDVRDPGNLGAVIRSAAAAGADGVVCAGTSVDPFNPKVVRASAGTIFSVPLVRVDDVGEALSAVSAAGYRVVATVASGGTDYAAADLSGDVAVVLGNESAGLPAEIVDAAGSAVTIPMSSAAESLNVAMTATVLAFEVMRRRRARSGTS